MLKIIPLKVTKAVDIAPALASWIDNTGSHSDIRGGLRFLSSLRDSYCASFPNPDAHPSVLNGMELSLEYHGALLEIEDQCGLPREEENNATGLRLDWKCAYSKEGAEFIATSSLRYEQASILFNVAALQSHTASIQEPIKSGFTVAVKQFSSAAGIFSYLRKIPLPIYPDSPDLSPPGLEMFEFFTLAQGQSCVYEMANLQQRPMHSVLAKIAEGAAELYGEVGIIASKNPSIARDNGGFVGHAKSMQLWFLARAEQHDALGRNNQDDLGLRIGRLRNAVMHSEKALSTVQTVPNSGRLHALLEGFTFEVAEKLNEAERRNEVLNKQVPENLPVIRGQRMTKPDVFRPVLGQFFMKAYFKEKVFTLVERTKEDVKADLESARQSLAEVKLPQSLTDFMNTRQGLPQEMWSRVQQVQSEEGMEKLKLDLWHLRDTSGFARSIIKDLTNLVQNDQKLDEEFRHNYPEFSGNKVTESQVPVQHYLKQCEWLLANASNGDNILIQMLEIFETDPKYKLLQYNKLQLDMLIPNDKKNKVDTSSLSKLLVELTGVIKQRENILQKFQQQVKIHDIDADIDQFSQGTNSKEHILHRVLSHYQPLQILLAELLRKQHNLMSNILAENEIFTEQNNSASTNSQSSGQRFVDKIDEALSTIGTVTTQVAEGHQFYNSILPRLEQLKQRAEDMSVMFAMERCDYEDQQKEREERKIQEMKDLTLAKRMAKDAQEQTNCNRPSGNTQNNSDPNPAMDKNNPISPIVYPNMNTNHNSNLPPNVPPTLSEQYPNPLLNTNHSQQEDSNRHQRQVSFRLDPQTTPPHHQSYPPVHHVTPPPQSHYEPPPQSRRSTVTRPGVVSVSHDKPYVVVDDEKVASLIDAGFDTEKVVNALEKHDNNMEHALNELLSS